MIEFTTSINGKQIKVGVFYQHHRGYRYDPLRRMSKEEAQWEVIAQLSQSYQKELQKYNDALEAWKSVLEKKGPAPIKPKPPTTKQIKAAFNGPDVHSGTTCHIWDLSSGKKIEGTNKLDFTSCTLLGQGTSILSKLDNFSARTGRQDSLKRAVKSMNLSSIEKKAFWDAFFEARKEEIAVGWTEAAVKCKTVNSEDIETFAAQQRAILSSVEGSKVI